MDNYDFTGNTSCTSWGEWDSHFFSCVDNSGYLTLQWDDYRHLDCSNQITRNAVKNQLEFCLKILVEMEKMEENIVRN